MNFSLLLPSNDSWMNLRISSFSRLETYGSAHHRLMSTFFRMRMNFSLKRFASKQFRIFCRQRVQCQVCIQIKNSLHLKVIPTSVARSLPKKPDTDFSLDQSLNLFRYLPLTYSLKSLAFPLSRALSMQSLEFLLLKVCLPNIRLASWYSVSL